jgi:hypothetical protein
MNLSYKVRGKDIRLDPLKTWDISDGSKIAIYQGGRSQRPDLDFIVKYRKEGTRLRTPSHTHWIVDLIVKGEVNKELTLRFVDKLITIYDSVDKFETVEERDSYELIYPRDTAIEFSDLNTIGALPIEFIVTLVELFSRCEKQTDGAFMFRSMLNLCRQYLMGEKDYYQLVGTSKRV